MLDYNSTTLFFYVNGKKIVEEKPDPEWTLLYYLRVKLNLKGSKEGCGEGGCGACTVMQSYCTHSGEVKNMAINACLTPLCSVYGTAIVTVEGIGGVSQGPHPVQERIAKSHGTQCGFCTSGFVMSMYALLRNTSTKPTEEEMEEAFQGNLCRCTGYRPILDGFATFCSKSQSACNGNANGLSNGCCKNQQNANGLSNGCCQSSEYESQVAKVLFDEDSFAPYDPSFDIIFPSELQLRSSEFRNQPLHFKGPNCTWYRPTSLTELLELKKKFPGAKIIAGNTELGVELKFKGAIHPILIHVGSIPELKAIRSEGDGVYFIGAAVTLAELLDYFSPIFKIGGGSSRSQVFSTIEQMLRWFGGQQIRNVATIGGNLMTASPIADLNPILMAMEAEALIVGEQKVSVPISQEFFQSYRKTIIQPEQVLQGIRINMSLPPGEYVWAAKQSRRKEDDISIVTTCMRVRLNEESRIVENASLVFGGMAAVTAAAARATDFLVGKEWTSSIVSQVLPLFSKDFPLTPSTPGGMASYRLTLAGSLFFKFFLHVQNSLHNSNGCSEVVGLPEIPRKSSQLYQLVPKSQKVQDLIGRPVPHISALNHATGKAEYTDDIPPSAGELHGSLVLTNIAHGRITSVCAKEALALPGVLAFFDSNSIPKERNVLGVLVDDEEIFASKRVTCAGQVIGIVVAVDPLLAEKAAKLVKIVYEELPPIISILQAIQQESFHAKKALRFGTFPAEHPNLRTVSGEVRTGGQEHFYMETQSCIVTPKEGGEELHIQISGQGLDYIQKQVARALGMSRHKVFVHCRRAGGAFGGKESRNAIVAAAAAIAANQDDMVATGGRHPFLCRYIATFNCKDGRIGAVKAQLYSNGGNSWDTSPVVMERALLAFDSVYNIPAWDLEGFVCKTNLASNTAFRGYGAPQALLFCETILSHVAQEVGKSTLEIREMHLKKDGDPCTTGGGVFEGVTISQCWRECLESSKYFERLRKAAEFNEAHRWRKRGLAIIPVRHDLGFHAGFMNQGGALLMVFTDGTVSLNFGGVEMGQGIVTKMIQVASRVLEIPVEKIHFSETSTHKVPNATATCGSMSSDLNGMAVVNACEQLLGRLLPYKKKNPEGSWEDWVNSAYFDRVNLSATGFYELPHLHYDFENPSANIGKSPFNYCAYGVAVSEVEIDCLTGDHIIVRTDIVMDVGESLNPAVDIGQIEGAFIQGVGLYCMEELLYNQKGQMLTKGPGSYKIPSARDTPREFNVSLLRGSKNERAVFSSKGIGEPPLMCAISVYFGIVEAIREARIESGDTSSLLLDSPLTVEKIRMACTNEFITKVDGDKEQLDWAVRP